jgi:hypothetical protein
MAAVAPLKGVFPGLLDRSTGSILLDYPEISSISL